MAGIQQAIGQGFQVLTSARSPARRGAKKLPTGERVSRYSTITRESVQRLVTVHQQAGHLPSGLAGHLCVGRPHVFENQLVVQLLPPSRCGLAHT